jgi:hypothetical protein
MEIELNPPANLNEDVQIEPSGNNTNNNQQNQNQSSESHQGDSVKKYNILLQSRLLNIENPHIIHNGFLNENSRINFQNSPQKQNALHMHQNLNSENMSLLQLMSSDPIGPSAFNDCKIDEDSALLSSMQVPRKKVLRFNNSIGQENKVP